MAIVNPGSDAAAASTCMVPAATVPDKHGYCGPPIYAMALPDRRGVTVAVGSAALALVWSDWDALCAAVACVRRMEPRP